MSKQGTTMRAPIYFTASALLALSCSAGAAGTIAGALRESKPLFDLRVRYESVDQSGFADNADPLTARLRAGIQTGEWRSTSLLAEAVALADVAGDYNDTLNGATQFPVVADPGDIEAVNRFALTNKSLTNTALTLGRQRIVLDDSRFVGNVGWRQFEQTYDGLRAVVGGADSVKFDLSYISQVNRIFGPDSPNGKLNGDVVLVNVSKSFGFGTLTGFVYSLDLDQAAALSTNTVGLRLSGSKEFDAIRGTYVLSLARQTDTGDNAADLSELYVRAEGGLGFGKVTIAIGLEQLGSDGVNRVTTPLATLHAFQGWADKFLATPAAGIDDTYARFAWQAGSRGPFTAVSLQAIYHEFDADFGSARYGDEFDIVLNARTQRASYTLKYAAYDADELFTDTDKIWLSMDYSF